MIIKARTLFDGKRFHKDKYIHIRGDTIVNVEDKKGKGEVINAEFVTPAFIDAHSHIGMERAGEPSEEGESNEQMDSIVTLTNALDSIYMDDKSFKLSIENGILYSCVLPGSGNIIGGKAVIIRNFAKNIKQAYIKDAGIKMAIGYNPRSTTEWKGTRPSTRMGVFALLRKAFREVTLELNKKKPELNPEQEVIRDIIKGKEKLRVHVHKEDDIYAFLRFANNYNLKFTFEHTMDVSNADVYRELANKHIPVIYGPLDSFPYKVELKHEYWRHVKLLKESGVEFGLMSDHPVIMQYTLPLTLRHFLRTEYTKEEALSILTSKNAKILGLKDLGEIKKGKKASLLIWSGNMFDLSNRVVMVIAEGNIVYEE